MKIRNGWVGNSSSSSFILLLDNPENREEFETWFEDCGYRSKDENEKIEKIKSTINSVKTLYNNNSISFDDANTIIDSMRDTIKDIPGVFLFNNSIDNCLLIENNIYYSEFTCEKVMDLLWDAWNKQGIANCSESEFCKEDNIRVFNKIEDWKEQLDDKNSYLYQTIQEEVERGLRDNLDYKINGDNINLKYREYHCFDDTISVYDISDSKSYRDFIDMLTQQKIDYIRGVLLDDYKNLNCYVITFCSDDGESTDFDYIGRSGYIFRDTLFCIRNENS